MEKQLHIKRGSRTLNVKGYVSHQEKPTVTISCIETWDDDGSALYQETEDNQWATFYLQENDIDVLIEKLNEAKAFLNGG